MSSDYRITRNIERLGDTKEGEHVINIFDQDEAKRIPGAGTPFTHQGQKISGAVAGVIAEDVYDSTINKTTPTGLPLCLRDKAAIKVDGDWYEHKVARTDAEMKSALSRLLSLSD